MAQKRCRVICRSSVGLPWTKPMKSSRYTSTWARSVDRVCRDRASHLLLASRVASVSYTDVCGGLVSAKYSR